MNMKKTHANNPVRIQFTNGSVTKYVYGATGEKLRVTHQTAVPNITVPIGSARELLPSEILSTDSTDYLLGGALTLRNLFVKPNEQSDACIGSAMARKGRMKSNGRIDKYQFDEGYCRATAYVGNTSQDNFAIYYYDRDHLGSNRQVILALGNNGTVVQRMDYYPFGAQLCDGNTDSNVQPHRYNGKELDKMHGLNTYDYGARQYNPVTARWDRMDPLSEKYYGMSPYAYCGNNPMRYIDSDGRDYSVYVDNDNGTILISAFFYCTENDYERCSNDCSYWNQQSGHFSAGNYEINFLFTPIVVDNSLISCFYENDTETQGYTNISGNQLLMFSLYNMATSDTNTYLTVDNIKNDNNDNIVNGRTTEGRIIRINNSSSNSLTGKHEIGHTIGLGHHSAGLMTPSSSDVNRNDQIYTTYIKEILKGSLPNRKGIPGAGKGHLFFNGEKFDRRFFNKVRKTKR